MLPAQRKKVDLSTMNDQEKELFARYGRIPTKKKTVLDGAIRDRKFFDSGDYAMAKAGKTSTQSLGTTVPSPDNIPHSSPQSTPQPLPASPISPTGTGPAPIPISIGSAMDRAALASSPVKESRLSSQIAEEVDAPDSKGTVAVGEQGSLS